MKRLRTKTGLVALLLTLAAVSATSVAGAETPGLKAIYAFKYGEFRTFPNFGVHWMGNPRFSSGQPMAAAIMYFWLIRTADRNILVDAGTSPDWAQRYAPWESPETLLDRVGVKADDIDTVIVSHPHFDHVDGLPYFKKAKVLIQRAAYQFTTEGAPESAFLRTTGFPRRKDAVMLHEMLWDGRLKLLDGENEIAPGIKVIRVDGHYPGMQVTVVATRDKPVVLASDAIHQYVQLEKNEPPGLFQGSLRDAAMAVETIRALNGTVVSGHDRQVMERFKQEKEGVFRIY